MPQQTPGLRFQRKLEAMTNRADRWQKDSQIAQWPGLSKLLKEFSDFAKDYIRLLEEIPRSISRLPFALNTGVERLLQEWSILSRACEQRLGPEDAADKNGFQFNLSEAGKFAKNYCDRWHPQKPVKAPYLKLGEPVVYFEKLYGISRAIYAPEIPVISIPLTDYNDSTRWQALAHELGHHIYWNGVDLRTSEVVHARLQDVIAERLSASLPASGSRVLGRVRQWASWLSRTRMWGPWVEEVFADVCGTLLAGPNFAASAQELEADRIDEKADLTEDDQQHPCGCLRPLIAIQVLREIAEHSADQAFKTALTGEEGLLEKLEGHWMDFCGKAGELEHEETGLTMEVLAADIPTIVRAILYEPVWPESKSLWDLVEFYGKEPTAKDVEAFKRMELTPLPPIPDGMPLIRTPPPDIGIAASFKGIWQALKDRVEAAGVEEKLKPMTFWSLVLGLELSEAAEYHTHQCTRSHSHPGYCPGKKHKHPQDGSTVTCCS